MRVLLVYIGFVLLCLCFVNFAAFSIGTFILGGDAINGKVEDGRYYLGDRDVVVQRRSRRKRLRHAPA